MDSLEDGIGFAGPGRNEISFVAAFFYLKVVVAMWFKEPERGQQGRVAGASGWTWIVVAVSAVATIVLGLVPGSILDLAAGAAQFIR